MRSSPGLLFFVAVLGSVTSANPADRQVLAFYYNWYGTPQFQNGKYLHWEECRGCSHNPDNLVERTNPANGRKISVPDTGTTNHPVTLYDSTDPAVIRRHLKMAERAGIDGLIATWWGRGLYHDRALALALDEAAKIRSPVKFTVYYEQAPRGAASPIDAVVDDFRYLLERYGRHPSFFRHDGKPVVFVYGRAMNQMKPEQWREAVERIRQIIPCILIADSLNPNWLDIFDGQHEYNPVGQIVKKADMGGRYRSTVAICRARARISCATVIPGYDDSNIGRARVIAADRESGALYTRLWTEALNAGPDWMLITSFNEWHEGSEIETSREWGEKFLQMTRRFSRRFKARR